MITGPIGLVTKNGILGLISMAILFFGGKKGLFKTARGWFLFIFIGYWVVTLGFRGDIPPWYYSPLVPIIIIFLADSLERLPKKLGLVLGVAILISNMGVNGREALNYKSDINLQPWSTWQSTKTAAEWMYQNCGNNFGYFVYTPDMYGYPLRYAMQYVGKSFKNSGSLNSKLETVCLLMGKNVAENPYGRENWLSGDVKIIKKPVLVKDWGNGMRAEKYLLDERERKIGANSNLIIDQTLR